MNSEADDYFKENLKLEREHRRKNPLENILKGAILGQDSAISIVSSTIRRKQNGWAREEKPIVFLFLGSSGVGKTELAKQLGKYIHPNNPNAFIRLDLSEFQDKHEVSKLIGSPPGYIGHEEGGQLTSKLKENPNSVVLLDEVEKAHPDVLTVMLQLFDEGRITDGRGQTVHCADAIFVMTSNLAQREIADQADALRSLDYSFRCPKRCGIPEEEARWAKEFVDQRIMPILRAHFKRDEFLGRINEVIFFLPFNDEELRRLVTIQLQQWAEKALKRHAMELTWTEGVVRALAKGFNKYYGARSISNEVDRKIVNRLAEAHERELIWRGSKVRVSEEGGEIGVRFI